MITEKENDFYFKLRNKISIWLENNSKIGFKWKDYILIAPDLFYLLLKLVQDKDVPQIKKVKLLSAIAYFISPIDVIPEALVGPVGYLDDILIAAYVLNDLINSVDPQIVKRNWVGSTDILYTIKKILINVDNILGKEVWDKLKKRFD